MYNFKNRFPCFYYFVYLALSKTSTDSLKAELIRKMLQESIKNKSQLGKHKEQRQLAFRTMPSPSRLAPHRTYHSAVPDDVGLQHNLGDLRNRQTNMHSDLSFSVTFGTHFYTHTHSGTHTHTETETGTEGEKCAALPLHWSSFTGTAALISAGRPGRCRCCCCSRCKCNLHMHETVADIFANVRGANDRSRRWRNDCATQTTARQARNPKPLHTFQRLRKLKPS